MNLTAGTRLGPYEILQFVGSGGMGEVYRARDLRLDRDVAIKILPAAVASDPTRRARLLREAQALSQLNHPHICAIYDVGEHEGATYLVMEFIAGESLEQRLRLGRIVPTTAVTWATQVASALDAAHRRGIVHRDLKPANIMLADSGVKLLDFGIAKLLDEAAAASGAGATPTASLTAERALVGTLQYMSPEQLEGRAIDGRTDLFSLGATLYEMLTGRQAFEGASPASLTAAVLMTEPPAVSALNTYETVSPVALDHVVRRALAKNADERWQTARDFMIELRSLQEGQYAPPAPARAFRPATGIVAAAVLAVLAIVAAVSWAAWPSARAPLLPIEFVISPPAGSLLTPGHGRLAISRDGRRIAFVAGTEGSPGLLAWQGLDSSIQQVLPSTEGANGLFWSPDGEWIGYFSASEGLLKRVPARGGLPQVVATVGQPPTPSAYWGDDHVITFALRGSLNRVSATGGPVSKWSDGGFTPRPLPGGRVMSVMRALQPNNTVLRVEGGDLRQPVTLPVDSNAVYTAGHLVFRRGETLVAQPFDPQAVRFTGPPVPLVENVNYNPGNGRTVFDASESLLVSRTAPPRRLAWRDRDGRFLGTVGEGGRDWNPVVAPDASLRVAVDRVDVKGDTLHIWVTDSFGRSIQLSRGQRERFPMWSPDAQWIAFTSIVGNRGELRRARANGDAGEEVLYTSQPGSGRLAALDYTNDYLIFEFFETGGRPLDLFALPLRNGQPIAGATPIRLTETPDIGETLARVSPDGRWLAYTTGDRAQRQVWIRDLRDGNNTRQITTDGGYAPTWRQDGKELYYVGPGGTLMAVPVQTAPALRLGTPELLFSFAVADDQTAPLVYASAPDGQRFLVRELSGAPDVITVLVNWMTRLR